MCLGQKKNSKIFNYFVRSVKNHKEALRSHGHKMRFDYTDGDADLEAAFYILLHTPCAACVKESEVGLHCKGKLVDKNLLESGNIVLLVED